MKLAASLAATLAFVSLFEPILSDDRLARMTPDPSHEYPSIQYKKPKCGPGEVAKYSLWVGYRCVKKMEPYIKCNGTEAGECERLCKETGDPKECAHLKYCDIPPPMCATCPASESGDPACNDRKSCKGDEDCDRFGYPVNPPGAADRKCEDRGEGKKCYVVATFLAIE